VAILPKKLETFKAAGATREFYVQEHLSYRCKH
jgi:hypothetical protein